MREIVSPSKMKFPSLTGGSPGGRCWYSRSLLDTTESFLMQSWMVFTWVATTDSTCVLHGERVVKGGNTELRVQGWRRGGVEIK